jgi:hypothetical protein
LMRRCEESVGAPVEIEFALTLDPPRFGFLQVRPMVVSDDVIDIGDGDFRGEGVVVASRSALGNGADASVRDIVYVRPDTFDFSHSREVAADIDAVNAALLAEGRPYLLIGFGRWGSSDPWLGIPVAWDQVSGAKVIVEATHAKRTVDLSQGSHFFHNLISFRVLYFSIATAGGPADPGFVDWEWLGRLEPVTDTGRVRRVRTGPPLAVRVDGRTKKGVIRRT